MRLFVAPIVEVALFQNLVLNVNLMSARTYKPQKEKTLFGFAEVLGAIKLMIIHTLAMAGLTNYLFDS